MRFLVLILFLGCYNISLAQEDQPEITLNFENATIPEVLNQIKEVTNLQFFYVEDWFEGRRVSGNYRNTPMTNILEDIFRETYINFFFLDEARVILTRNNIIYDSLPEGFFPEEKEIVTQRTEEEEVFDPVFYSGGKTPTSVPMETVYIGREERNRTRNRFGLTGYIYDRESGEPISNLAIVVRDRNIGTVTGESGFYSLQLPAGENILETRSLGSENLQIRVVIYNDGELNLHLSENFEALGEVFLRSNPDENVKSAYAGEENIDVREIRNIPLVLGERDIMRVATLLPGISIAGEGAAGFNVRGGNADQNLILLDDAVMYNPAHFFGIFSAINPFTTGEVTIYKGSIPAQYGGRLSSVFDITTKDANTEKFAGEVSLGPVTGNVALEIPIIKEKSGLLIGGRSTYSNWILNSLEDESLKNSQASFYDLIAKYNHRISDKTDVNATGYFS